MKSFPLGFRGRIALGLVLTLLTPVAVVGLSVALAKTIARLPPNAAFRANGVVVTKSALEQRVRVLGALYGLRAPSDPVQRDEFQRGTAKVVVTSMVLDQAIADRHLTIPDAQARGLLDEFIEKGLTPPGQETFVRLLRDTGASEADVLDELKRQRSSLQLFHQVTDPLAGVSEEEVRAYYNQHPAEMAQPEQRHLQNIVVSSQAQANELLNDIRGGADFMAVAQQSSLDQKTRAAGGDIGFLTADQLEKPYADTAFSAPAGSLFGPTQTVSGWNIGKVVEVRPQVPLSFEQVHDQLAAWLRARKAQQIWQAWIDEQVARAEVTYADEYRPAEPHAADQGPGIQPGLGHAPAPIEEPR